MREPQENTGATASTAFSEYSTPKMNASVIAHCCTLRGGTTSGTLLGRRAVSGDEREPYRHRFEVRVHHTDARAHVGTARDVEYGRGSRCIRGFQRPNELTVGTGSGSVSRAGVCASWR